VLMQCSENIPMSEVLDFQNLLSSSPVPALVALHPFSECCTMHYHFTHHEREGVSEYMHCHHCRLSAAITDSGEDGGAVVIPAVVTVV
jgi:hypothetical protein